MLHRGYRARTTRLMALVAAVLVVGAAVCANSPALAPTASNNKLLGTKNPAKGTPVKIGFVTNDKNDQTDNSIETPVADATVKWINDYMNGIGGHPIDLDRCVDLADPSKGTDCANQMIQDKVAAVVIGSNAVLENVWTPLHKAGIPVFLYGASNADVVADAASTFVVTNGRATSARTSRRRRPRRPTSKKVYGHRHRRPRRHQLLQGSRARRCTRSRASTSTSCPSPREPPT